MSGEYGRPHFTLPHLGGGPHGRPPGIMACNVNYPIGTMTDDPKDDLPEEAEEVPEEDEEEVIEEHLKAREEAQEERAEAEKERSEKREREAEEVVNPDMHRDEPPEGK